MRDLTKRRALGERIRWLVGGRITNDAFDDFLYDEGCIGSEDRTIDEIASWAWTLYSDTHNYRLRGRQQVDQETRAEAVRAIIFLRCGRDYEWPSLQEPTRVFMLRWLHASWWLPTMACLLVGLWNYGATFGGVMLGPLLLIATACVAAGCLSADAVAQKIMQPIIDAFDATGERSCWPFLDEQQLANASRHGYLLAP